MNGSFLKLLVATVLTLVPLCTTNQAPIKVGVLHSTSGVMAISEIAVIKAEKLAIKQINQAGGVLGRQIQTVEEDGASEPEIFKQKAEQLCQNTEVAAVFGCWTSSSRKAVQPVFEKHKKLLFYPVQYEGEECSKYIFYGGAAPNQQIEPAVRWLLDKYTHRRMYLVGSDYVFPRTANNIIKSMLKTLGGILKGDKYIPLSGYTESEVFAIVDDVKSTMPNGGVVFNTLNGEANLMFFKRLQQLNMGADKWPVMSVSITETEIKEVAKNGTNSVDMSRVVGHFASWNFFQPPDNAPIRTDSDILSREFLAAYRAEYGPDELVNDPMEAAYINVWNWVFAVERAQSFDTEAVRKAAYGITFDAPEGTTTVQTNHHLSKYIRLGEINQNGLFDVIFSASSPVLPVPWNQWLPSSNGYVCDHASEDKADGTKFKPDIAEIVLTYTPEKSHVLNAQLLAIEEINNNYASVLGRTIVPTIVNLDSGDSELERTFEEFRDRESDSVKIQAMFATSLSNTQFTTFKKMFGRVYESKDEGELPLVFFPPPLSGELRSNFIQFGLTASQLLGPTIDWFDTQSLAGYYFVGLKDDPMTQEAFDYVKSRNINLVGSKLIDSALGIDSSTLDAMRSDLLAQHLQQKFRIALFNLIPGDSPNSDLLFATVQQVRSTNPSSRVFIASTGIDERQLKASHQDHYAVAGYFREYRSPGNAVLLSSYAGRYGDDDIVTEESQKAYTAIHSWFRAVRSAETFDATRVRVNLYRLDLQTSSGPIEILVNNKISHITRIAKVIKIGDNLKYRPIVGADDLGQILQIPYGGLQQGEPGYFGALTNNPDQWDALRVILVTITSISLLGLVIASGYTYIHRNLLIIKLSGHSFLQTVLLGCMLNLFYVYVKIPVNLTQELCMLSFWFMHSGFIIVFGCLLYRCYGMYLTTRPKSRITGVNHKRLMLQVGSAIAVFTIYMLIRSFVDTDLVKSNTRTIEDGITYEESYSCRKSAWEYTILGFEIVLICFGVMLALGIRGVKTRLNEAFHMGMTIYVWAFVRILSEVFLEFVPFNPSLYIAVKAFAEIIPSVHTSMMFLQSKLQRIHAGKGNDEISEGPEASSSSAATNSVTKQVTSADNAGTQPVKSIQMGDGSA